MEPISTTSGTAVAPESQLGNSGNPGAIAGDTKTRIDHLTNLVYAIMTVLFVGFAGMFVATASMLVDAYKSKQGSYEKLSSQMEQMNASIEKQKIDSEKNIVEVKQLISSSTKKKL